MIVGRGGEERGETTGARVVDGNACWACILAGQCVHAPMQIQCGLGDMHFIRGVCCEGIRLLSGGVLRFVDTEADVPACMLFADTDSEGFPLAKTVGPGPAARWL